MDTFTLQHPLILYDSHVKCSSAGKSQRKFRLPMLQVPHRNTIHNLVSKVRTTGMLTDRKTDPQCQVLTEKILDEIGSQLEHWLCKSLKHPAQEMGVSKGTARSATKSMNLQLYETTSVYSLQPHD
jgi:hypothetical protein